MSPLMNEVAYYPELAKHLEVAITANLTDSSVNIKALYLPTFGSNIRSFLASYLADHALDASDALRKYSLDVPKIRTDIAVVFDNPKTNKFQILLIEAKLLGSAGLTQLSQLLGYCLVTKAEYGLLINIGGGISNELADIIAFDKDVIKIDRTLKAPPFKILHKIGIMSYIPATNGFQYYPTESVGSLPQVVGEIERHII